MLTKRQLKTLKFIHRFIRKNGYSPTGVEVAKHLGTTGQAAWALINQLAERGYVRHIPSSSRTICILKPPPRRAFKVNPETLQLEEMT